MKKLSIPRIIVIVLIFTVVFVVVWQIVIHVNLYRQQRYRVLTHLGLGTTIGCFAQHNDHRLPNGPLDLEKEGYIKIVDDGTWLFLPQSNYPKRKWDPDDFIIAWGSIVTTNGFVEGTTDYIVRPAEAVNEVLYYDASKMASKRAGRIAYEENWKTPKSLAEQKSNG